MRSVSCLIMALCLPASVYASTGHPHPSVLTPITQPPASIKLEPGEQDDIRRGNPILRQSRGEDGGRGVAVQLVNAPAATVWQTILAYDKYSEWVDNVESCEVYQKKGSRVFVSMKSSFMWISSELFTINDIHQDQGYMSWVLDRSHESDVQDMIGYWRVEELESTPPVTRLDYATEIVVGGVPDFIVTYLTENSLVDGTAWVKRESEKSWGKRKVSKATSVKQ